MMVEIFGAIMVVCALLLSLCVTALVGVLVYGCYADFKNKRR